MSESHLHHDESANEIEDSSTSLPVGDEQTAAINPPPPPSRTTIRIPRDYQTGDVCSFSFQIPEPLKEKVVTTPISRAYSYLISKGAT
jgi:hypothetical protein